MKQLIKNISIIGAGWLGAEFAKFLDDKGLDVTITYKNQKKNVKESIKQEYFDAGAELQESIITKADIVIIMLTPHLGNRKDSTTNILEKYKRIVDKVKNSVDTKVFITSSTSVYPNKTGIYSENFSFSYNEGSHSLLIDIENLFMDNIPNCTVLRLGGLIGYDRFPLKYYLKKPVKNAQSPVNYLYRDDFFYYMHKLIFVDDCPQIINMCSPIHYKKEYLFRYYQKKYDYFEIDYSSESSVNRLISSHLLHVLVNSETVNLTDAKDFNFLL